MAENRYSAEGQAFTQEVHKRARQASVTALDPSMSRPDLDAALAHLAGCPSYTIAAFSSATAFRGSVGLGGDLPHVVETLESSGKPVAMVALGNPYLLRTFANLAAYLATFSNVPPSERAAVKAIWGEIDIRGHLPVSIPGEARLGDGIQLKATRSAPATDASH
jgi:beta-N-acetylhexosaminidase